MGRRGRVEDDVLEVEERQEAVGEERKYFICDLEQDDQVSPLIPLLLSDIMYPSSQGHD